MRYYTEQTLDQQFTRWLIFQTTFSFDNQQACHVSMDHLHVDHPREGHQFAWVPLSCLPFQFVSHNSTDIPSYHSDFQPTNILNYFELFSFSCYLESYQMTWLVQTLNISPFLFVRHRGVVQSISRYGRSRHAWTKLFCDRHKLIRVSSKTTVKSIALESMRSRSSIGLYLVSILSKLITSSQSCRSI